MRGKRQMGFSLIELLVVVALICVFLTVLFPALQHARAAARRESCINNLKQVGLAMHNYLAAFTSFPLSMTFGEGHGNGHGVGMGQWGAQGYAQQGYTYDQILEAYYPGTTLGDTAKTSIRVLLASGKKKLTISSKKPIAVVTRRGTVASRSTLTSTRVSWVLRATLARRAMSSCTSPGQLSAGVP